MNHRQTTVEGASFTGPAELGPFPSTQAVEETAPEKPGVDCEGFMATIA